MPVDKSASECKSIEDVRQQIDLIDQEVIRLFAKRQEYVKEVVKYKDKTEEAIIAAERKEFVINQRSEWAQAYGLDKNAYAKLFEFLVDHNIKKEMEMINKTK